MRLVFLALLAGSGPVVEVQAQAHLDIFAEFDARALSVAEKRFLQTALAFEGYYNGLLDGAWGKVSQAALERYAADLEVYGRVPNWIPAILVTATAAAIREGGWEMTHLETLGVSLMVPSATIRQGASSDNFFNLEDSRSSLRYSFTRGGADQVLSVHSYTARQARRGTEVYMLRRDRVWITGAATADGGALYTRSDLRNGAWSTVMLAADRRDAGLLSVVSGSISPGQAEDIFLPQGVLTRLSAAAGDYLDNRDAAVASASPPQMKPEADRGGGSGTGFLVSGDGHVLTNHHVVEGCSSVSIDSIPMTVIATDPTFDLALLVSPALAGQTPAEFAANPALLNSDVTVVGYPLAGLLGGLNVTRGSLTSLKGLGGDGTQMQISAPVQAGNSGGPVLNAFGEAVGVVVAKLDAKRVGDAIGDIPQNVNFAIRGEIAKLFLVQNNVIPIVGASTERPTPEGLAQQAGAFTKFVECK